MVAEVGDGIDIGLRGWFPQERHDLPHRLASRGGINVNLSNYYMLHVWVLDDMKFIPDVFAGQMPCITAGSTIHDDPDNPCHFGRDGGATVAAISSRQSTPGFVCHLPEAARV